MTYTIFFNRRKLKLPTATIQLKNLTEPVTAQLSSHTGLPPPSA